MQLSGILRALAREGFRAQRNVSLAGRQGREVYVGGLNWTTGRRELLDHFLGYGAVQSVRLFFSPQTGLSRGFSFVVFRDRDAAHRAIQDGRRFIDGSFAFVRMVDGRQRQADDEDADDAIMDP